MLLGSLNTRVLDTRTATGSELFSLLTCLHTNTFISLSIFSILETISLKIWERPLSWRAKYSLPVAVRVLKTRVLKLPIHRPGRPIQEKEARLKLKQTFLGSKYLNFICKKSDLPQTAWVLQCRSRLRKSSGT